MASGGVAAARASSGVLAGGMPFNRVGDGPDTLVVIQGLTFENRPLSGMEARFMLGPLRRLAPQHTVYVVNRAPGLPLGCSFADMAEDYATMIADEFGGPVDVMGTSTGGGIAQDLAAGHTDLVRRLIIHSSACRLGEQGRELQRDVARLAQQGRWREASRSLVETVMPPTALWRMVASLVALQMAWTAPSDPSDMVVTIEAEDAFDFSERLSEIPMPTLVVSGEDDVFYPADLARATAAGIPDARAIIYPGQRHGVRGKQYEQDAAGFLAG